jgi:diguanylate cyclase (GGDEF)-like protein/PAS domain S-box-containing protein
MVGYGIWMALLTAAFYAFPSWHMVIWGAIGVTSAAAVAVGLRRNRPRRRLPWVLICVAILAFVAGDTTYNVLTDVLGAADPFPSVADVLYLALFPLLATGLLSLARSGAPNRDRASLLDTLILTSGVGLLSWIFLISPYVENPDLTSLEKAVSIAYPLGDVLIVATVVRLLTTVRRSAATILLGVGAVGLLVADVLYGLAQLGGTWQVGGPVDLGWIAFYAGWGAAALHPSMARLTEPRLLRGGEISMRRLVLLGLSSLIAPVVLLLEAARGAVPDARVIGWLSALMFLLVLSRLAGVVGSHRAAVARERGLREAGAALVSATEPAAIVGAVRTAVARLLPKDRPHAVVLAFDDPSSSGTRLGPTASLPPEIAGQLGGFELMLSCPLPVGAHGRGGTLYVAAAPAALVPLQGPVEVLVGQAALAVERIALSEEIARRNTEEYFRTLVHNTADVILILNDDNRIRYASPSAATVFGREALTGVPLYDLVDPDDRELAGKVLDQVRVCEHGGADWTGVRVDGRPVQLEVSGRDLRQDPTVRGLVITLRDVTERRRLEDELRHQAFHDSLTGLANRVLFAERVQHASTRGERTGAIVGVLFIDLDDFKVVNDTLGHQVGDELLVAVGRRLVGALRPHDTAARLGGDEFAALIEDARDAADVEQVAERIVFALAEPFLIGDNVVNGVASIGVATTADAADAKDLLRQADLALYVAKGAGKGRWRRYQAVLHTAVLQRMQLRAALDQAVAEGAFTLQYQPIVDLSTGGTAGFEALVRWNHPTRGLVGPDEFIEVAEESGLIVPIGNWVLETVVAAAARWHGRRPGDEPPYFSINVSARQFRTPGFADKVKRELEKAGLPPRCLMLEITESLLLRDDEQVWADLSALRDIGVRVAIDDFGTGYSSLSYLRQVPIDVVKIDRSFIGSMSSSEQQRALVDGIVRLAHTLGLQVVAEGIERSTDRDALSDIGCPLGQGYLFSGPLSYRDAVRWLLSQHVAA